MSLVPHYILWQLIVPQLLVFLLVVLVVLGDSRMDRECVQCCCPISDIQICVVSQCGAIVAVTHELLSDLWGNSVAGQHGAERGSQGMKISDTTLVIRKDAGTLKVFLPCRVGDHSREHMAVTCPPQSDPNFDW